MTGTQTDFWGRSAWRIYLGSMVLSFFVMIEPAPTDLVFFFAAFALLLSPISKGRFLNGFAISGILLYLVFSVVSLFFVQFVPLTAMRAVVIEFYMIGLFCMTAYFCATKGDEAFFKILVAYTIGAVLCCFVGYLALADVIPNSEVFFRGNGDERNRLKSTFKDPNVLGPFLVVPVLFTAWLSVSVAKFRALSTAVCIFMLIILIATLSRGAMINAVISLFVFALFLLIHPQSAFRVFAYTILILIITFSITLLYLDEIVAKLDGTLFAKRLSLQNYDDRRFGHVYDAMIRVSENPLGIGPAQARYLYDYLPHNTFVVFAMHNGVMACIGFALIYFSALGRCIVKVCDRNPGWTKYGFILSLMLGLLVLMQVVGSIHWRHLYVICGFAFGNYVTDSPAITLQTNRITLPIRQHLPVFMSRRFKKTS